MQENIIIKRVYASPVDYRVVLAKVVAHLLEQTDTYGSGLDTLESGTPERIRTSDLLLRRQTLYPD